LSRKAIQNRYGTHPRQIQRALNPHCLEAQSTQPTDRRNAAARPKKRPGFDSSRFPARRH
jgi:hypothetical protein